MRGRRGPSRRGEKSYRSGELSSIDVRRRNLPDPKCLFVGNLPFSCSTEDVLKIFQRYRWVVEVYLPFFPGTSKPRGYGFVRFCYEDDAKAAMGVLHGKRIDGREVTVKNARSKPIPRSSISNASGPQISQPQQTEHIKDKGFSHLPHPIPLSVSMSSTSPDSTLIMPLFY
ncbi:serine/arginine-rich splicing factor SC35-like [Magnolia sinica]|uniref:serine/arginine-rich splicing factor SC35-like n=1 Tax=Magnolia sinica TaxID=86752 RepID=UPI00265A5DD7|nr:serine/arginine-rich splicing factor SC35-like [Magnolia sinica]